VGHKLFRVKIHYITYYLDTKQLTTFLLRIQPFSFILLYIAHKMATPGGEISTKLNAASAGIVEAPGADGGDQDKSTPMGGNASTAKKTTSSTKKKTSTVNRKKKDGSTTGISGTPTNARIPQTMLSAASASAIKAEKQLHEQRANAEARKNDAAWLKPDLVNRVLEERQRGKTGPVGFLSQEAQIVDRALAVSQLSTKELFG